MNKSCSSCGFPIIENYRNQKYKLRARILVWDGDGECTALCKSCGAENKVPITLEKTASPTAILVIPAPKAS